MPDVTAYIGVIGNEKAEQKFKSITNDLNEQIDLQSRNHASDFARILWGRSKLSHKEVRQLLGGLDRLFIRDEIDDEIYTQSGPRPPEKVVMRLAEILTKEDPDAIVTMTYLDDEATFYGAFSAFLKDGEINSYEDEEWVGEDEHVCWDNQVADVRAEYGADVKIRSWDSLTSETEQMLEETIEAIRIERSGNI